MNWDDFTSEKHWSHNGFILSSVLSLPPCHTVYIQHPTSMIYHFFKVNSICSVAVMMHCHSFRLTGTWAVQKSQAPNTGTIYSNIMSMYQNQMRIHYRESLRVCYKAGRFWWLGCAKGRKVNWWSEYCSGNYPESCVWQTQLHKMRLSPGQKILIKPCSIR